MNKRKMNQMKTNVCKNKSETIFFLFLIPVQEKAGAAAAITTYFNPIWARG